jgi:hypothetical protein
MFIFSQQFNIFSGINDIDSAEAEEGLDVSITPTKEILISSTPDGKNPAHIMNMIL